jgi:hypothetical protein
MEVHKTYAPYRGFVSVMTHPAGEPELTLFGSCKPIPMKMAHTSASMHSELPEVWYPSPSRVVLQRAGKAQIFVPVGKLI